MPRAKPQPKPTECTDEVFDAILAGVRAGDTLHTLVDQKWAPTRATLYEWLADPARLEQYEHACKMREITWKDEAMATYQELLKRVKDPDPEKRPTKDELTTAKSHITFVLAMIREARQERKAANPVGRPGGDTSSGDAADAMNGVIVELVIFQDPETPPTEEPEDILPGDLDFFDEELGELED